MTDLSPEKKQEIEKKINQELAQLDQKTPELVNEEFSFTQGSQLLSFIMTTSPQSILEVRQILVEQGAEGIVLFQQFPSGLVGLPVPKELLFSDDLAGGNPDDFVLGMRRFYTESNFATHVVVGVTTQNLDSVYGLVFLDDLRQHQDSPAIESWQADIETLDVEALNVEHETHGSQE